MKRAASIAILTLAATACGVDTTKTPDATGGATPGVQAPAAQPAAASNKAGRADQTDVAAAEEETETAFAVANESKLPPCTDAREGAVAYVRSTGKLLACSGKAWGDAPVENAAGIDGLAGKDGRDGKDGKSAALDVVEAEATDCAAGGVAVTPYIDGDADGKRGNNEVVGETRVLCDGAAGANGRDGAAGSSGVAGAAGAAGANGATGSQGSKGDKGDKGDTGTAGANGATGSQGSTGAQGATGAAGANGTDNHIVARYSCTGAVYNAHFSAGAPTNLSATYKAYVYASGDVRASAYVYWDDAAGQPAGYSVRFSEEYAAGDGTSATAVVTGKQNWVTGSTTGLWTWTLDKVSNSVAVRYDDADMNPTWVTFSHTCTRTTY